MFYIDIIKVGKINIIYCKEKDPAKLNTFRLIINFAQIWKHIYYYQG